MCDEFMSAYVQTRYMEIAGEITDSMLNEMFACRV